MTTSFISPTVSPDLIITTPEQLTEAFKTWATLAGETGVSDLACADMAGRLIGILKGLNKQ